MNWQAIVRLRSLSISGLPHARASRICAGYTGSSRASRRRPRRRSSEELPSSWSPDSCSLSPRTKHTSISPQARRGWSHFTRNWKSTRLPRDAFRFPTTSPCQRIWFGRSPSTVSALYVNVKTKLSGNSRTSSTPSRRFMCGPIDMHIKLTSHRGPETLSRGA